MLSRKVSLLLILAALASSSCALSLKSKVTQCADDFESSKTTLIIDSVSVHYLPAAPDECPGGGFPAIRILGEMNSRWVQIIRETPFSRRDTTDESLNLEPGTSTRTFLDVTDSDRSDHIPFYYGARFPRDFFENPTWDLNQHAHVKWSAHVYELKATDQDGLAFRVGIEWGFQVDDNNVSPLPPQSILPKEAQKDMKLLNQLMKKWDPSIQVHE